VKLAARSLAAAIVAALALAAACRGRPRPASFEPTPAGSASAGAAVEPREGEILEFDLSAGVPESTEGDGLLGVPASRTFTGLVRAVDRAVENEDATGFYVKLGLGDLGWAQAEEAGRLLERLRKTGKPVICHAHGLGNRTAWVAGRGCDRIWLSPAGDVETMGIAGQVVYLKGALDKLHVRADFLQMGRYKSAVESLTREGPSEDAKESLLGVLGSLRKTWLDGVAAARKAEGVREAVEHGPFEPKAAKQRGLIDAIGYESDALADAKQRAGGDQPKAAFGPKAGAGGGLDLSEIVRILSGADRGGRPRVAVVVAEGSIGMSGGGLFDSGGISARALNKTLRRLAKSDAVKAVVLRIDSPGGSALASDLVWHELRELGKKKPVVASVGDLAASGGYYIACAAQRVIAEKTSIVGSIGVFGGKIALRAALAEVGINSVTFAASPEPGAAARAAYLSALEPWDDATREQVRLEIAAIYELFVERVAESRKLPAAKVREVAEGRIWSGVQGKQHGLVDELGGLERALAVARELGKLDADAPVVVEGGAESLLEALLADDSDADAEAILRRLEARGTARTMRRAPLLGDVGEQLAPFVAAVSPLAERERSVAALPFALIVR
jgi:protease-4